MIEQRQDKKYYLTELGLHAYNSLKDNIELITSPNFTDRKFKSPILRKLMFITSKRLIQFKPENKIYPILASIMILIIGTTFCILNKFSSFLFFFIANDFSSSNMLLNFILGSSFILNYFIFFIIIEGISQFFFNKREKPLDFLISFAIVFFPMVLYLLTHFIFAYYNLMENSIINLIDKVLLIIFQVWSLWLLSYSLTVKKNLKIENSLIVSLVLHYVGFTIILLILI